MTLQQCQIDGFVQWDLTRQSTASNEYSGDMNIILSGICMAKSNQVAKYSVSKNTPKMSDCGYRW